MDVRPAGRGEQLGVLDEVLLDRNPGRDPVVGGQRLLGPPLGSGGAGDGRLQGQRVRVPDQALVEVHLRRGRVTVVGPGQLTEVQQREAGVGAGAGAVER
jgi:hypothetical protein